MFIRHRRKSLLPFVIVIIHFKKSVWQLLPNGVKVTEVVTYGITRHPNDPDRTLMLLNFFEDENLNWKRNNR